MRRVRTAIQSMDNSPSGSNHLATNYRRNVSKGHTTCNTPLDESFAFKTQHVNYFHMRKVDHFRNNMDNSSQEQSEDNDVEENPTNSLNEGNVTAIDERMSSVVHKNLMLS